MTQEEIIEGNKLIAEFMGKEVCDDIYFNEQTNAFGLGTKTLLKIEYHSSWDWLMPVVEKIEKEHGCIIEIFMSLTYGCRIHHIKSSINFTNDNNGGLPIITGVYLSVVEFIKWYNINK